MFADGDSRVVTIMSTAIAITMAKPKGLIHHKALSDLVGYLDVFSASNPPSESLLGLPFVPSLEVSKFFIALMIYFFNIFKV